MKRTRAVSLMLLLTAGVTQAAAQAVTLAGRLEFVWGDPLPFGSAPPRIVYHLFDDAGNAWELRTSEAAMNRAGGARGLNRQRVVVRGTLVRAAGDAIAVESITLERPADRDNLDRFRATGSQPYVWILVRFADDTSTPEQPAWFETQALGPAPSLDHFWRELSFEQINLTGSDVVGWYDLPEPRSHYVHPDYNDPNNTDPVIEFTELAVDAATLADAEVFFPDFIGINICLNGILDGAAWGGGRTLTIDGETRDYGVTWMPGAWLGWRTQGILAHEMGHALSLPHSSGPYGETYDSQWDVMSHAFGTCSESDPVYGCLGTGTIGYHKDWLSWIPAARRYVVGTAPEVTTVRLYDLDVLPPAGFHQYVRIPAGSSAFYTVEARRLTGYDRNIPAAAVLINRIDYAIDDHARVVDPDGNGNCNDEGAQWQPGEWFYYSPASVVVTVDWADATSAQVTFTNAARSPTFVDYTAAGYEDGSAADPWNTIREGFGGTIPNGIVYVRPGTYTGLNLLAKPATLLRNGVSGVVTVAP